MTGVQTCALPICGKDAVDGIEGVETEEEAKAVRVPYQAITKDNLDLAKSTYE